MKIEVKNFEDQDIFSRQLSSVENIIYIIKEAERMRRHRPILLIGAGTSVSSGIPLASSIRDEILTAYKQKPKISRLGNDAGYFEAMKCLSPAERNNLFKGYFDKSRINISNLLIANLLKQKKLDYVLSVNFDDLLIRASALLGYTPSFYDIANIRDLTTSNFPIGSILYLHGFQYSSWLLNTDEEFRRVEKLIPQIFSKICNDRSWIVVGYSGEDAVLEHLCNLGRFDNDLYWICYETASPRIRIKERLLSDDEKNAYSVYGFNSDRFFLELHYGLNLKLPDAISKPFSYIDSLYDNIVEIDFRNIKNVSSQNQMVSLAYRIDISREMIKDAIKRYEEASSSSSLLDSESLKNDSLLYRMLECTFTNEYETVEPEIEEMMKSTNGDFLQFASYFYDYWGGYLLQRSRLLSDTSLLDPAEAKFKRAIQINPKNNLALVNLAILTLDKAKNSSDRKLFTVSFDRLETAIKIEPDSPEAYHVWANGLKALANLTKERAHFVEAADKYGFVLKFEPNDLEALIGRATCYANLAKIDNDPDYMKASDRIFETAYESNERNDSLLYNWGTSLYSFGKSWKTDDCYLKKSLEKFEEATFLNPKNYEAYNNCGNALLELAVRTKRLELFVQCTEKYKRCTEIKREDTIPLTNWGNALLEFARATDDKSKIEEALLKYETAYEIDSKDQTNLIGWGGAIRELGVKTRNINYFKQSIKKFEEAKTIDHKCFNLFLNWGNTLYEQACITKEEATILEACDRYREALRINPEELFATFNLAEALILLAEITNRESYYEQAIQMIENIKSEDIVQAGMYNSWGLALLKLGVSTANADYIKQSLEKFDKAQDSDKPNEMALFNRGLASQRLYELTGSMDYLIAAIDSFQQSLSVIPEIRVFQKKLSIINCKLKLAENTRDNELFQWCFNYLKEVLNEYPNNLEILNTWASHLLCYSRISDPQARSKILIEAKEKANLAMKSGGSCYNLACCYALLGDEIVALAYLDKSLHEKAITVDYVINSEDWAVLKNKKEFLRIIDKYSK